MPKFAQNNAARRLLSSVPSSVVYEATHSQGIYEIKRKPGLNLDRLEKSIKDFIKYGRDVIGQSHEYKGQNFKPDKNTGLEMRENSLIMSGPTLSEFSNICNHCLRLSESEK